MDKPCKTPYQLQVLNRIKLLRKEHKFTQIMMAELLHTSNGQVGNSESWNQSHKYTLSQINIMCRKFSCPISMIFLNKSECSNEELIEAIIKYEEGL